MAIFIRSYRMGLRAYISVGALGPGGLITSLLVILSLILN